METITIESIEHFTSSINHLEQGLIFRGHGDINYKLIPSIGRFTHDKIEHLLDFEKTIFNDFKRKAYPFLTIEPSHDLEWLFLAQHHGLPTRLLDWTYNPLVAVFFAIENELDLDACIYEGRIARQITPDEMHKFSPFTIPFIYHLIPNLKHTRYQNQNGLFTIHPKPTEEDLSFVSRKFIIPKKFKWEMRTRLRTMGIVKSLLFPSLDSLSYDISRINERRLFTQ